MIKSLLSMIDPDILIINGFKHLVAIGKTIISTIPFNFEGIPVIPITIGLTVIFTLEKYLEYKLKTDSSLQQKLQSTAISKHLTLKILIVGIAATIIIFAI
jgi:hypothetical protein